MTTPEAPGLHPEAAAHFPPHPLQRGLVALALGVLLGLFAALMRPRRPEDDD